jgi:hypothetical protein
VFLAPWQQVHYSHAVQQIITKKKLNGVSNMVKYHDEKQHGITGPQPTAVVEKGKVSGESLNANTIEIISKHNIQTLTVLHSDNPWHAAVTVGTWSHHNCLYQNPWRVYKTDVLL